MKITHKVLFVGLLCFLFISSCKKDDNSEMEIEYTTLFSDMMEIDVSSVDSYVVRETDPFPTALDGELSKKNTSKSKIKSAKLSSLRLQLWDFVYEDTVNHCNLKDLSEIVLEINAEGLGATKIAYKMIPDVRTNAINFILEDVELREYLKKDYFTMIIKYKKRRPMYHDMSFIITPKFKIIADPL